MTAAEFMGWQRYAAQRMLPSRRAEFYLARIAQQVAVSLGGAQNTKLGDFLFEDADLEAPVESPPVPVAATSEEIAAEYAAFGFKPRALLTESKEG